VFLSGSKAKNVTKNNIPLRNNGIGQAYGQTYQPQNIHTYIFTYKKVCMYTYVIVLWTLIQKKTIVLSSLKN